MSKTSRDKKRKKEREENENRDIDYVRRKEFRKKIQGITTCDPYGAHIEALEYLVEYIGDRRITNILRDNGLSIGKSKNM